jgi:hypothetical protein
MIASTTQETFVNSKNSIQKESSLLGKFIRSLSTLEPEEFNNYIQQEYGACWGTLKFDDSLSDYSNEVKFDLFSLTMKSRRFPRLDHFFMLMIVLIYMPYDNS